MTVERVGKGILRNLALDIKLRVSKICRVLRFLHDAPQRIVEMRKNFAANDHRASNWVESVERARTLDERR